MGPTPVQGRGRGVTLQATRRSPERGRPSPAHPTGLARFLGPLQHLTGLRRFLAPPQHLLAATTAPYGLRPLTAWTASWVHPSPGRRATTSLSPTPPPNRGRGKGQASRRPCVASRTPAHAGRGTWSEAAPSSAGTPRKAGRWHDYSSRQRLLTPTTAPYGLRPPSALTGLLRGVSRLLLAETRSAHSLPAPSSNTLPRTASKSRRA